jgi:hypothetical protein
MDELLTPEVVALLDGLADLRESDPGAYEATISSLVQEAPTESPESKGGPQHMTKTPKAGEGESTYHAYRFAMKESDPESYRQTMERTATELRGEMIGSTGLAAHAAGQARKRQQRESSFDFIERNRLAK